MRILYIFIFLLVSSKGYSQISQYDLPAKQYIQNTYVSKSDTQIRAESDYMQKCLDLAWDSYNNNNYNSTVYYCDEVLNIQDIPAAYFIKGLAIYKLNDKKFSKKLLMKSYKMGFTEAGKALNNLSFE